MATAISYISDTHKEIRPQTAGHGGVHNQTQRPTAVGTLDQEGTGVADATNKSLATHTTIPDSDLTAKAQQRLPR